MKELLEEYDVSYIFVGSKEREKYGETLNEDVLKSLGEVVFRMRCIVPIFLRLISKGVKNGGSFAVIFCVL